MESNQRVPVLLVLVPILLGPAAGLQFYGESLHLQSPRRNGDGSLTVTFYSRQYGRSSCQDESSFSCQDGACIRLLKFPVLQTDRDNPERGTWCQSEGRSTAIVNETVRTLVLRDFGCCWVSNVGSISSWSSGVELDLGTRSDSGSFNRCPVTATLSSLWFPQNCFHKLRLLAHDPDGDHVRCRYGNQTVAPSGFNLDQAGCTISSLDGVQTGRHVFEVVIEDFPVNNLTVKYHDGSRVFHQESGFTAGSALCKVKLQFTVTILVPIPSCEVGRTQPMFLSGTPSHGEVLRVAVGEMLRLSVPAQALEASIQDFQVSGPQNVTKLVRGDTVGKSELLLSWTPQKQDLDRNVPLCFSAQTQQTLSEMRCVVVMVTETPSEKGRAWVQCVDGRMLVVLEKASMPGIDVKWLKMMDPKCSLTSNQTHIMGSMSLHTCGTTVQDEGDVIVFRNEINSFESSDSVITRRRSVKIGLSCQFPKTATVSSSFSVRRSDYVFTESSFGSFSYAFQVFRDADFKDAVRPGDFPVAVRVMEKIFMGIQARADLPGITLFVESCRATPDDDPDNDLHYALIQGGCIEDETLKVRSSNSTSFNFEVQAFKFTGNYNQVYISCTVLLCEDDSQLSRCARGCLEDMSRRRRRGLGRETQSHYITQGPLQFVQPDDGVSPGNQGNITDAQTHNSDYHGDGMVSPDGVSEDSGRFWSLMSSNISTAVFAVAFLVSMTTLAAMVRYYRRSKRHQDDAASLIADDCFTT